MGFAFKPLVNFSVLGINVHFTHILFMKYLYLLLFVLVSLQNSFSQEFVMKGTVTDPEGVALESATVYLERIADSTLVTYGISDQNGIFKLEGNTEVKTANLFISYAGFKPLKQQVEIKEESDLGQIKLKVQDNQLDEVVVVANRAPVVLKKDTLEFNAASFETRPDANLEELLKKLPGAEVDSDGAITINGKPITRILVNGKEFFGNDPKIATKNLPKEIIEKLQVVDTKSRAQEFTGEAGDSENKTINITIKKDKNKGYFTRATLGGGTNDRYEMSGIGNVFKDNMRTTVLAGSNNINSSGFDFDDIYGMMGRAGARAVQGGNNNGITKAETAGLNYSNEWSEQYDLNGDYYYDRSNTDTRSRTRRENILPDTTFFSTSENSSKAISNRHRANARVDVEFDTLTRLSYSPSFNTSKTDAVRDRMAASLDGNGDAVNTTETSDQEAISNLNVRNNLDFIRRFGSRGAFFRIDVSQQYRDQQNDNFYFSESEFFGTDPRTEIQDQFIDEDEREYEYGLGAEQRFVLASDFFLDLDYNLSTSKSTNARYVYEADTAGNYTVLNDTLSSNFEVKTIRNRPTIGLRYDHESWRINADVGVINTVLKNDNLLTGGGFDNSYNNLSLRTGIRYELQRSKSISLDYSTNASTPSIRQLQPVPDRTNPLNIVVGNPGLRPAFSHNIGANFRSFNFASGGGSGIFSSFSLDFTENQVVQISTVDEDRRRRTTYANVDGARSANARVFYTKSTRKEEKEFRYRLSLRGNYDKNVGFTNGVLFNSDQYRLSPGIRLTFAIQELFELNPSYDLNYNKTNYSLNSSRDQEFVNHTVGFEATTFWPKNVVFGNDITYNYNGNVSPGFQNSSVLWNTSLGYQFLDEKATLKIKVYDLLDQVVDTRRITGDDFVQDTNSLILTQYAMLSFTYKLKSFGGASQSRGRGGYRR